MAHVESGQPFAFDNRRPLLIRLGSDLLRPQINTRLYCLACGAELQHRKVVRSTYDSYSRARWFRVESVCPKYGPVRNGILATLLRELFSEEVGGGHTYDNDNIFQDGRIPEEVFR